MQERNGFLSAPKIREFKANDITRVLTFTERYIGLNYFTEEKLLEILAASKKNNIACSFVLEDSEGIKGIRFTYPPTQWIDRHPSQPVHPDLWRVTIEQTGYFQSLFIAEAHRGYGWGQRLSMASIESLKMLGARAVVCHSWDESPHDSSRKYLLKLGYQPVVSIPKFWMAIDYECIRCGKPCQCTATEMILYF